MKDERLTYCGLYCGNCYQKAHVGPDAERLHTSMKRMGYERIGPMIPGFQAFWQFLSGLAESRGCLGCRQGGGNPYCKIRACAQAKAVELCALCEQYPCKEFDRAFLAYTMLRGDNAFLREQGLGCWLEMQENRRREGYTYTDANEKK